MDAHPLREVGHLLHGQHHPAVNSLTDLLAGLASKAATIRKPNFVNRS
jgi:hypothetical protein